MANNVNLRATLANIIADYRVGEIHPMDEAHVDQWINQFPDAVRDPILAELVHVFNKTYLSRKFFQTFIDGIVTNTKFTGGDPTAFWPGVKVLNLQIAGNSQRDMIALLSNSLERQLGLVLDECGARKPHTYLYVDDALFSGGRIRSDLEKWVTNSAPVNANVAVLVIGLHALGEWYSNKRIKQTAEKVGKTIDLNFWRALTFEDRKFEINNSDVLRPTRIPADPATADYVASLDDAPIMRVVGGSSAMGVFSGEAGRDLLEQQLLIAGVRVRDMCPNLNKFMRPLGSMLFDSFGFGSTIVSYRNCPNNAPLVFWAGNPWYPLFPRKTN